MRFAFSITIFAGRMRTDHLRKEQKDAIRTSYYSMVGNTVLAAAKGITGVLGHSYALIADAIESTADIFSSFLVIIGLRVSTRPADKNHPYGHGKAEAVVTFAVVTFLLVSAVIISIQSIHNIQTPHESPKPFTLIVLGIIIAIKEFAYRHVKKHGKSAGSTMLEADAWHHRSDAITSAFAFVGISIAIWLGPGYEAADDWAALVAAIVIVYNAYRIFRPALSEVMDENRYEELILEIRSFAEEVDGVCDTEKCYVRKMGMEFYVDLHLIVDGKISVHEGHHIAHAVKDTLMVEIPEIAGVHIHVEPDE